MKQVYLAIVATLFFVSSAFSANISSDDRAATSGNRYSDGGYFEFGVNLNFTANEKQVRFRTVGVLAGAYRYRRFFFEAFNPANTFNDGPVGVTTFGYNIWGNDRWAVDLIGLSSRQRFSSQLLKADDSNSIDQALENAVLDRDATYNGAGVRLTGYFGNTIFQYRLEDDSSGNGITHSARVGYSRQVKNWNIHGFVSANYLSEETGQYWYGISEGEASTRFPQYSVGSSTIAFTAELGATVPVRDNVVFRIATRYTQLDSAIAKSPIQESEFEISWTNSLSYVF